ncbi:hypothetical protein SAMN05443575_1440 [Jatrophihabitans endophyticus]|uniref:Uncharacterized protein n=1 Tax=Jatrophihabitans endophyticus TaxID=1206085 RepID=A0A1M5H986_9ACTN|nr:hypothetical protein [Jatrophihabitans endophyticus]SHG12557.1 hypothetical protein SAMN05443575_1440 [Jatrophihabitans endophyticus]
MGNDFLKFDTEQIASIAKATQSHQAQWDEIWNGVKARLSATAAEALSQEPGGSLEHRTQEYHRKTQQYNEQLLAQSHAVTKVGGTAEDYNGRMTRTIAG